jgi:hypothetical protein
MEFLLSSESARSSIFLKKTHLHFRFEQERVHPFCKGFLLDVKALLLKGPDTTLEKIQIISPNEARSEEKKF